MANKGARIIPRTTGASASAAVSVALHALVIGASVIATAPEMILRHEIPEVFMQMAAFLAPPERTGGQAADREQLKFVALGDPSAVVRGSKLVSPDEIVPVPDRKISGVDMRSVDASMAVTGSNDSVFTVIEVDSAATRYAWSAAPAYPQVMLDAKKEGFVKAQWVVDEMGYADTTTLRLLDWSSAEFAQAVRDALPFMRFSPAKVGDKVVKQLVQQEFTFRITSIIAGTGAAKKPES